MERPYCFLTSRRIVCFNCESAIVMDFLENMRGKISENAQRILLVDNYDSYTFNLYQLLKLAHDSVEVIVIRNDQFEWKELSLHLHLFDGVVISPGPGNPSCKEDFGICSSLFENAPIDLPVLGICLGHQGLALHCGARVVEASRVCHGFVVDIQIDADSVLFSEFPETFKATRYHSLIVDLESIENTDLIVTATCQDYIDGNSVDVIMAIHHKSRPLFGVQFHPESICSEYGRQLIRNFLSISCGNSVKNALPYSIKCWNIIDKDLVISQAVQQKEYSVISIKYEPDFGSQDKHISVDTETLFNFLFQWKKVSIWLDSAKFQMDQGRYSIMAGFDETDKDVYTVKYWASEKVFCKEYMNGLLKYYRLVNGTIFDYLKQAMPRTDYVKSELPFLGGLIGYVGYEMKSECNFLRSFKEPDAPLVFDEIGEQFVADTNPDLQFLYVPRFLVYDHFTKDLYQVDLHEENGMEMEEYERLQDTNDLLKMMDLLKIKNHLDITKSDLKYTNPDPRNKQNYIKAIRKAQDLISKGETYEVCLTTQWIYDFSLLDSDDTLEFYRALRRNNPAPFGAYLNFGNITIASSSPEKFLSISTEDQGIIMKPIKGTLSRCLNNKAEDTNRINELEQSQKDRAENLMITDLIRNDLNVICNVESVKVPKLMTIETYETVHQMVTEVKGTLRKGYDPFDALKSCFPPGSMTGAPKRRTVELIEELESQIHGSSYRGIYSGVIGYLSSHGSASFSVVIRTAVFENSSDDSRTKVSIGAGGAVTALSNENDEYAEMETKAHTVLSTLFGKTNSIIQESGKEKYCHGK